jgi:hypothetical protein
MLGIKVHIDLAVLDLVLHFPPKLMAWFSSRTRSLLILALRLVWLPQQTGASTSAFVLRSFYLFRLFASALRID